MRKDQIILMYKDISIPYTKPTFVFKICKSYNLYWFWYNDHFFTLSLLMPHQRALRTQNVLISNLFRWVKIWAFVDLPTKAACTVLISWGAA